MRGADEAVQVWTDWSRALILPDRRSPSNEEYMMELKFRAVGLCAFLLSSIAHGADPPKPAPPPPALPDMRTTRPAVLCIDCDAPFDTTTHKAVLEGLLANPYNAELRRALYLQDTLHQFESRAHFDNCDFDSAIEYIESFWNEANTHVDTAQKAKAAGNAQATSDAARKAFFALGQALHGTQDFYAHSNYVELAKAGVKRVTDMEVIAPWRPAGKARIKALQAQGLVSGHVFWGFPQKCPDGAKTHAELAKDSETTLSGKQKVPHLQNISQYGIAVFLAREASQQLMRDAFRKWPLLKELNGPNAAFEVLLDRRGL